MESKVHKAISDALVDPTESLRVLSRSGVVSIPWWRRLLFKIPYKRTLRMQRYILKQFE
jgi:hypothetical protein